MVQSQRGTRIENIMLNCQIKKRTIFAIFVTILVVFAAKKLWFVDNTFNFEPFTIILVLTYLLAYKLSDYVANFNTIKEKSKTEIIFLCIFFIFLFIPMSHINQDEISKQEKRTLAKWEPFIEKGNNINYNFGKNFNNWFNDRFNLRTKLIALNNIKLVLNKNSSEEGILITKDVIIGKDNWLFFGNKESTDSYTNSKLFTDDELVLIDNYLKNIDDYCKEKNAYFYLYVAPDKSKIYPEYYNKLIKPVSKIGRVEQIKEYAKNHSKVKIIYPKEALIKNKDKALLYFKQDTHWTDYGGYIGYLELINNINVPLNKYKIKEFTEMEYFGDLNAFLPDSLKIEKSEKYKVPVIENRMGECKILKQTAEKESEIKCTNNNGTNSLLMYRDSFTVSLEPYLAKTFKNSELYWEYKIDKEKIKENDIVILEVVERNLTEILRLAKDEIKAAR